MERKRRFGDRKDGRLLRTLTPFAKVSPYIMQNRIGSQNLIRDSFDMEPIDKYIRAKREEGLTNFGVLHFMTATYIRTVSQRPAINRFVSGQKIYARKEVEVAMTIKRKMLLDAEETEVKIKFPVDATAKEVYEKFTEAINENRKSDEAGGSNFDITARVLHFLPNFLLRFVVWILKCLDYVGLLPSFLTDLSPFHGSIVITSMGSLGIPPIYHHLYDFGNIPVFLAYGAKRKVYEMDKDGNVIPKKYLDFTFVTDERICDGFYFASALHLMHNIAKRPSQLDTPPKEIIEDID